MYKSILILATVIISLMLLVGIGWQQSSKQARKAYVRGYDEGAMSILSKVIKGENIHYQRPNGDIHDVELTLDTRETGEANHIHLEHETDPVCSICHLYSTDYYIRKEV